MLKYFIFNSIAIRMFATKWTPSREWMLDTILCKNVNKNVWCHIYLRRVHSNIRCIENVIK